MTEGIEGLERMARKLKARLDRLPRNDPSYRALEFDLAVLQSRLVERRAMAELDEERSVENEH